MAPLQGGRTKIEIAEAGIIMITLSGGDNEGVTPVPIPNTEVKPFSADGTWLETARESRSLPDSISAHCKTVSRFFSAPGGARF